jgi:hypothetical protein
LAGSVGHHQAHGPERLRREENQTLLGHARTEEGFRQLTGVDETAHPALQISAAGGGAHQKPLHPAQDAAYGRALGRTGTPISPIVAAASRPQGCAHPGGGRNLRTLDLGNEGRPVPMTRFYDDATLVAAVARPTTETALPLHISSRGRLEVLAEFLGPWMPTSLHSLQGGYDARTEALVSLAGGQLFQRLVQLGLGLLALLCFLCGYLLGFFTGGDGLLCRCLSLLFGTIQNSVLPVFRLFQSHGRLRLSVNFRSLGFTQLAV